MSTYFMKIVFLSCARFTKSLFNRNIYLIHEQSFRLITLKILTLQRFDIKTLNVNSVCGVITHLNEMPAL